MEPPASDAEAAAPAALAATGEAAPAAPEAAAPAPPEVAPAPPAPAAGDAGQVNATPAPALRQYKADPPPSAEFALDVKRVDADGTIWSGAAVMSWRFDGDSYGVSMEAGLNLLFTRVNLLALTSDGGVDDSGIAPVTATEKRKGRAPTVTHFNRKDGRITFSGGERAYPLQPGAQDKATLPFQLAAIGRADVNQLQGNIDVLVGEDNEANVFRFHLVGEDELNTKMGRIVTWHLSRPPKPGTYSSRLDIWLAPSRGWYPVQIKNTEANGAVTTQSVSNITETESRGR